MKPCKYLDHEEGKYIDCEIVDLDDFSCPVKYWKRGKAWTDGGNPEKVQFCKQRGRINEIFACYNPNEMSCHSENNEDGDDES